MKRLLPVALIALGITVFGVLRMTRRQPQRKPAARAVASVHTLTVALAPHTIGIASQGTLAAANEVSLQAEVGGRIVWEHPALAPGGHFARGDTLVRVDARDYELAVQAQRAGVDKAALELELERGRKMVAEREWQLMNPTGATAAGMALALREPQLRAAMVNVEAAQSALDAAELALSRTRVCAPFNGFIVDEKVAIGRLVAPRESLATLVGTDAFWVRGQVSVEALAMMDDAASVLVRPSGSSQERQGVVMNVMGSVDATAHQAQVLVAVPDPFGLHDGGPRLLLGTFVELIIRGHTLARAAEIPRRALQNGDQVYVATAANTLAIRKVNVAWRQRESLIIDAGLADGDRVIHSRVAGAVDGMAVQVADD